MLHRTARYLLLVAATLLVAPVASRATSVAYTSRTNFETAAQGPTGTLVFDSIPSGTTLSGTTQLTSTGATVGITFPNAVPDVLGGPGDTLDLQVVAASDTDLSLSGIRFLGTDDPANFNMLMAGTDIPLSFSSPVFGFGLSILTADEPNVFVFDGDLRLESPGLTAAVLSLSGGEIVGSSGSATVTSYFLGVISDTPFSEVTLTYDAVVPAAGFFFVARIGTNSHDPRAVLHSVGYRRF